MHIKERVSAGKMVRFVRYQDSELWYVTDDGFEFPVPISDTGTGVFAAEDKAILFMRWIRQQMSLLKEAREKQFD